MGWNQNWDYKLAKILKKKLLPTICIDGWRYFKEIFVFVIKKDFMINIESIFFNNNFWALDFMLKTNQNGLPLYAVIVSNQYEIGVSVSICYVSIILNKDMKRLHKS